MRKLLGLLAILGIIVGIVPTAMGAIQQNDDIYISLWQSAPAGQTEGPFHGQVFHDSSTGVSSHTNQTPSFDNLVFCVETHEYFSSGGSWFNVTGVGTSTQRSGRLLTGYSAWVYEQFKSLAGTNGADPSHGFPTGLTVGGYSMGYVMNRYQDAIWAGMVADNGTGRNSIVLGDVGALDSEYGSYYGSPISLGVGSVFDTLGIGTNDFLASNWVGATDAAKLRNVAGYGIIQINVDGYWGQDQLFVIGQNRPVPVVPEPASVVVWSVIGAGAGLGAVRRRRARWSEENRNAICQIIERGRHN